MSLLITIVKAPDSIAVAVPSMSFDEQGGTMGRGEENNWVLDDPELYLSSLHCEFSFENGQYYLIDRSTNGTFYNNSVDPMGKGSRLPVNHNDRFIIGDYEFSISIQNQPANVGLANDPFSSVAENTASLPGDSLFGSDPSIDSFASSPFDNGPLSAGDPLFAGGASESDPLAALDKARGGAAPFPDSSKPVLADDLFSSATHSDGANPLNQQLDWPEPKKPASNIPQNVIPDDWDLDSDAATEVVSSTLR